MKACVRLWSASNQLKAPVAQMSDSILHQINNHPVDIHVLRKAKGVQTTTYCMRCNHLEQTPAVLFPCGMFHYCLLQAPVVQKVEYNTTSTRQNIIKWIVQLVFLIYTYPLNPMDIIIYLLNNQAPLCSKQVSHIVVGKLLCTC